MLNAFSEPSWSTIIFLFLIPSILIGTYLSGLYCLHDMKIKPLCQAETRYRLYLYYAILSLLASIVIIYFVRFDSLILNIITLILIGIFGLCMGYARRLFLILH